MLRSLTLVLTLALPSAVHACTCSFMPASTESVRAARDVFTFRLVEARVAIDRHGKAARDEIVGKVELVERIRGTRKPVREMRFSLGRCCGSRFDVGGYFVAFVNVDGETFVGHSGNVVEIGNDVSLQGARDNIAALLKGDKRLEEAFPRWQLERTEQSPVPLPCP